MIRSDPLWAASMRISDAGSPSRTMDPHRCRSMYSGAYRSPARLNTASERADVGEHEQIVEEPIEHGDVTGDFSHCFGILLALFSN